MVRSLSMMVGQIFFLSLFGSASAEWVSDIAMASPTADKNALKHRGEKFWLAVRAAAEDVNLNEHEELLDSVEGIVAEFASENVEVAKLLRSCAKRLQRTSSALFLNAVSAGELAGEKISQGFLKPKITDVAFSALGDVFGKAIRRFRDVETGGSQYDDEARRGVAERQEDILPVLRQTADVTGNILTDTRLARKEAYDVLKYNLYVSETPKTPEAAEGLAWKLIDASKKMRQKFTGFLRASVSEIADDTASKEDSPAKILASSSLRLQSFGKESSPSSSAPTSAQNVENLAVEQIISM